MKWIDDAKGYGFIGREGADYVFMHYSAISGSGFRSLNGWRADDGTSYLTQMRWDLTTT